MEVSFDKEIGKKIAEKVSHFGTDKLDDLSALVTEIEPDIEPWVKIKKTPFGVGEMIDGAVVKFMCNSIRKGIEELKALIEEQKGEPQ